MRIWSLFLLLFVSTLGPKDNQCHGLQLLKSIIEKEQEISNRLEAGRQVANGLSLAVSGTNLALGRTANRLGVANNIVVQGPLLFILNAIDGFLGRYVEPLINIIESIYQAVAPLGNAVVHIFLNIWRSINQFIADKIRNFNPLRRFFKPKSQSSNDKDRSNPLSKIFKRGEKLQARTPFLYQFLLDLISTVIRQVILEKVSKFVANLPDINPLRNIGNKIQQLNPFAKKDKSQNIITNVVSALINIIPKWLLLRILKALNLFLKLFRRRPSTIQLALIFYLQWRIARSLAGIYYGVRNIIQNIIGIIMSIKRILSRYSPINIIGNVVSRLNPINIISSFLSRINPINIIINFIRRILQYFGFGNRRGQFLFPILSRIFRFIGTIYSVVATVLRLPRIGGTLGLIIRNIVDIINVLIRRVMG
ncbi:uncharacterized protein [Periplaneta americana]|uniref:uncharacterized protein n=1 Tax=Periplaneta americana TaxID=6978 RepID=UPI0037E70C74